MVKSIVILQTIAIFVWLYACVYAGVSPDERAKLHDRERKSSKNKIFTNIHKS